MIKSFNEYHDYDGQYYPNGGEYEKQYEDDIEYWKAKSQELTDRVHNGSEYPFGFEVDYDIEPQGPLGGPDLWFHLTKLDDRFKDGRQVKTGNHDESKDLVFAIDLPNLNLREIRGLLPNTKSIAESEIKDFESIEEIMDYIEKEVFKHLGISESKK